MNNIQNLLNIGNTNIHRSNKKGIIKISNDVYMGDLDVISKIFAFFRVLHIEFRYWENDTWYLYGESEKFEVIEEGAQIPFYDITFKKSKCDDLIISDIRKYY